MVFFFYHTYVAQYYRPLQAPYKLPTISIQVSLQKLVSGLQTNQTCTRVVGVHIGTCRFCTRCIQVVEKMNLNASCTFSRVVSQVGIFGWYWLVFYWNFTHKYQQKTWLVNFGIKKLAGAPFSFQKGAQAPFLMHSAPLQRKK